MDKILYDQYLLARYCHVSTGDSDSMHPYERVSITQQLVNDLQKEMKAAEEARIEMSRGK